ncbi:MAG: sialate O-acetylesterase [Armatimonadaceae bacterium]
MTRVFLLAGQSNMEGQSVVDLSGNDYNQGRGTLVDVLREPGMRRFAPLWDGKQVPTRPNVQVAYRPEHRDWIRGPLGAGFTPYADRHHFGPELAFGHKIAAHVPDPVLLVKCAWGGKSLYRDFRPPSAGGPVGRYYARMIDDFRDAITQLRGPFTVDAFVWYHGWNDGIDPLKSVPEYKENLVALIQDVRRDVGVPSLPAVIGEITGAWRDAPPEWERLRAAQKGAAEDRRTQPAVFVPTRTFVRKPEDSPNPGHGHHEFGNAATGLLVGEALGDAAVRLIRSRRR